MLLSLLNGQARFQSRNGARQEALCTYRRRWERIGGEAAGDPKFHVTS
jgi:hypothetical protein